MKILNRCCVPCLVLLLLLGAPMSHPPLLAQSGAQQADFASTVDVNVVNVDVYVTDKKGNPVPGLTAADFQVQEDGKKVKVGYFAAFGEARSQGAASSPGGPADSAANGGSAAGASAEGGADPVHIVLFVDNANMRPQTRNRALLEIGPFLERWAEDQGQVMILAFDGQARVQQHFTDNPTLIRAGLEAVSQVSATGFQRGNQRAQALASVQSVFRMLNENSQAGIDFARSELEGVMRQVEFFSESSFRDVVRTVEVMKGVISSLAVLPGRKAVVHLSDGLPMRPGEDLIFALQDSFRDGGGVGALSGPEATGGTGEGEELTEGFSSGRGERPSERDPLTFELSRMRSELARYDTSRFFAEMVALANANRVTFYTINGAGGEIAAAGADSRSDLGLGTSTPGMLSISQASLRESLQMMAAETGGLSLLGGTDIDGTLAKVEEDLGSYYSLGYSPRKIDKEVIRSIKVKVKGRGLKVRYRESYLARPQGNDVADRLIGALFLGVDENPHGVQVEMVEQNPDPEGEGYVVVFLAKIPIGELALTPQQGYHEATLELHVATMDPDGRSSPVRTVPLSIKVPDDQLEAARGQFYGAQLPLKLRAGEQRLAVGLWDPAGRLGSYVSEPIVVGGAS